MFQERILHLIAPDLAAIGRVLPLEAFGRIAVDQANIFGAAEDLLEERKDLICLSRCRAKTFADRQNILPTDSAGRVHSPVIAHPVQIPPIEVPRSGRDVAIFFGRQIVDYQGADGAWIQSGCLQRREIFEGGKSCLPVMTQKLLDLSIIEIFNDAAVDALLVYDVQPCSV